VVMLYYMTAFNEKLGARAVWACTQGGESKWASGQRPKITCGRLHFSSFQRVRRRPTDSPSIRDIKIKQLRHFLGPTLFCFTYSMFSLGKYAEVIIP
jgi:hypothetical protein